MTLRVEINPIHISEDEARELMFHHLLFAQRFFEALDDDPKEFKITLAELDRTLGHDEAARIGALAFVRALEDHYRNQADRFPEP